jgi:phage gpG-like protein
MRVTPKNFRSSALMNALIKLGQIPTRLLTSLAEDVTTEIQTNLSGRILQRRSGRLHDSWNWFVQAINVGWQLIIESDCVYARIHEFGGMTGKNHRTHIKATHYATKAIMARRAQVHRLCTDYMAKITVK